MNRDLYNAASKGDVDVLRQHVDQLEIQTTYRSNTALHIAAQFDQFKCTTRILEVCPSLLRRKNIKGETPLHMAAREGYADIVKALIECAKKVEQELESGWGGATKEILRATNVDGDTALHVAMRNCHLKEKNYWEDSKYLKVVRLLTKEDPEFQHLANNAKETPLYLAAEQGYAGVAMVDELLKTCTSPSYGGPAGRTALHAAILNDYTGRSTKRLLEWNKDLIKEVDMNGWTPLQCAAWIGNEKGVKELLKIDITTNMDGLETPLHFAGAHGYDSIMEEMLKIDDDITTNMENLKTALHIAAAGGHVSTMKEILSCYPDCWEMVNSKGHNVLHVAVAMGEESVINFIIEKPWSRHLINQKDNEGNTPLHFSIVSDCKVGDLWMHHRADRKAFNGKNMTPIDLVWSTFSEERILTIEGTKIWGETFLQNPKLFGQRNIARYAHDNLTKFKTVRKLQGEKCKEDQERSGKKRKEVEKEAVESSLKAYQSLVIVAALIATISFAAAFTIPGGYDGNQGRDQGMAVLARSAAFEGFLITNTLALISSITSVFLCLAATFYTTIDPSGDEFRAPRRYAMASVLILVALVAMMLAFITASFAVLAHSVALSVSTCIIACIPFLLFFLDLSRAMPLIISALYE